MNMNIKIEGAKELERKLLSMEPKLARKSVMRALRAGARPILARAKALVPAPTGALKKSLKIRALKKRRYSHGVMVATSEGWFKGDEFYGAFVEFGTSKMPPHPFMRPAFDAEKKNAEQIIAAELRKGIEQVGKEK